MRSKKISLVATTIGDGKFLDIYSTNIKNEGLIENVSLIIIPDKKTPKELYDKVSNIKKKGYDVQCPNVEEQDKYLKRLGMISKIIPYNSDNRLNIGYLMAYEQNCDILVSVDDDNNPSTKTGFFHEHLDALIDNNVSKLKSVSSSNNWYNICEELKINQPTIFARGYPYYARVGKSKIVTKPNIQKVAINAGLWLEDPDVDAMTWLSCPPKVSSFSGKSYTIAKDTWSPINTQNTSLIYEVIPAYYFVKMGYPIKGSSIDRYGDIFSGFFALKCAKHLGMTARFGSPVVNHIRNSHNYMKDVQAEMMCIQILEHFLPELGNVKLTGSNFTETYVSLSYAIDEISEKMEICKREKDYLNFFHETAYNMRVWIKAIKKINSQD